jgi:hypothetical protein
MRRFSFTAIIAVGLIFATTVIAAVATSTNYRIQFDSVNVGGVLSTSTNYKIEDTTGEIATGVSTSTSYKIKAGYQQMNEVYLAITSPGDVTLSPSIPGVSGGTANGSAAWTTTTDNSAGYQLTITASTSPALESGANSFADYTLAGAVPDFTFSVATTDSEFGFSPEGSDIVTRYKDNGSACNTGSGDTSDRCWDPLSTSATTIAQSSTSNHPSGVATTVKFRAESGSSHLQEEGTYTATTTVTVVSL